MAFRNYLVLGLAVAFTLSSCSKKDDDNGPSVGEKVQQILDAPYTDKTPEENKQDLEDQGIEFVKEMDAMMASKAMDVSNNFVNIAGSLFGEEPMPEPVMVPVALASSMGNGKSGAKEVFKVLKSANEDPVSPSEEWNAIAGTYAWNFDTEEFDFTEGGNEIIVKFPGLETDGENTAEYRIYNFNYVEIANPAYGVDPEEIDMQIEMPTSINASLTFNGTQLLGYSFQATYTGEGIPTYFKTTFSIESFEFAYEVTHAMNTEVGATYSLTHGELVLLELHADVSGNWSEDNIEENTVTEEVVYYVDEFGNEYSYEETNVHVENILKNSNAYFQILNIKIAGSVNMGELIKGMVALDEEYEDTWVYDKAYYDKQAELINEHAELVAVYADNNTKIAGVEAYTYETDDQWGSYYAVDMKLIFADESKVDTETYFGEGFSDLVNDLNELIAELNADYDLGIDEIE